MFATALKDLAVELDVAMFTATQVNAKGDESRTIRNEGVLSGGRSTINKADNGSVMARPTQEELDVLKPLFETTPENEPNLVTDIFKVRSGEWTQVRIWSVMNLGTLKKNRFEPSHALALALKSADVNTFYDIKSDSEDIKKYLSGQTLQAETKDGWTLITVDGYSIGWGKAVNNQIKNHYPKGLRRYDT